MTDQYQANNINSPRGARFFPADATLTFDDDVVVIPSGSPTLTLPSATQIPGFSIFVKSISGMGVLVGEGGQTIDGASSFAFSEVNQWVSVKSDGSAWLVASGSTSAVASSMQRRTYGSVVGVFDSTVTTPMDIPKLMDTGRKRGNIDLLNFISSYSRCLWDVDVAQGASVTRYAGLTFTSLNDIVDWINANVTSSGGQFNQSATFHCYDLVDDSIPPVDKIYGKNAVMSRMRGNGRYWSPVLKTPATSSWNNQPGFLENLWTTTWNGVPMGPSPFTDAEMACFWFSQNRRRMYQISGPGLIVEVSAPNGRNMLRVGDGARVPATATNWSPASSAISQLTYGYVNASGASWSFSDAYSAMRDIPAELLNGSSVILAQPLVDGSGNRSIFLKPVGIDQIFTDYFDEAQYQLEAVASWMNDGYRKVRPLSSPWTGSPTANSCGPFLSAEWMPPSVSNGHANLTGHTTRPGRIDFQLRDLITNRVSVLAQGAVHWMYRRRYLPLAAIVKNDAR